MTRLATLAEEGSNRFADYSLFVLRDPAGRFFIVSRPRNQVVVFDAQGRLLTVLDKQTGTEFGRVHLVPAHDGSILVYDYFRRALVPIGPDLKAGAAIPMPHSPFLARDRGSYIVVQHIQTPGLVGYPLHFVGQDGRVLRSFGSEPPRFHGGLHRVDHRVIAPGPDGTIWSAAPGRYVLERWDPESGTRRGSIAVRSTWFVESKNEPDEREPPKPIIESLWLDAGYLWALIRTADASWKPPYRPNVERAFNLVEYEQVHDWVVEAIDPESGEVVAHTRFDAAHWSRAPSKLLVSKRRTPAGKPAVLDVWTVALKRKERE